MQKKIIVFSLFLILFGCGQQTAETQEENILRPVYAELFSAQKNESGELILNIYDPKDKNKILARYLVSDKGGSTDEFIVIGPNIKSIAAAHSTQIGFIDALGGKELISAVGSKEYLEKGSCLYGEKLPDFFNGYAFDNEKLLELSPDVVIHTPGGAESSSLHGLIPVVWEFSSWEAHPLGRAEWIKFFGRLLNREALADEIFEGIEMRYNALKQEAGKFNDGFSVLSGLPYQNVWYIPSGDSYRAVLYKDAALSYPFADYKGVGSLALSFEEVLAKAHGADVWFFEMGLSAQTLAKSDLKKQNDLYAGFTAYKNSDIFICNTDENAFYEKGILEPDKLLEDYIRLPRKAMFPDYKPNYYRAIK